MSRRILVTGAAGFLGHHFVESVLRTSDWEVVGLDRLDGTATWSRLLHLDAYREAGTLRLVWHDLKSAIPSYVEHEIGEITDIVHFAASSHVDRSIVSPMSFVMDNVVGTCNLLEFAQKSRPSITRFINFSTDEVFGPSEPGVEYAEWARYASSNPYAASKAGAEELGVAFFRTYGVPVVTTHCSNAYGERQHPEKFIPKCIRNILQGFPVQVHTTPDGTVTRRQYVHARNVAAALRFLLEKGKPGDKYNIVGADVDNLALTEFIAKILGRPVVTELVVPGERPGVDGAYSMSGRTLEALGYEHPKGFQESLRKTVEWSVAHREWILLGPAQSKGA